MAHKSFQYQPLSAPPLFPLCRRLGGAPFPVVDERSATRHFGNGPRSPAVGAGCGPSDFSDPSKSSCALSDGVLEAAARASAGLSSNTPREGLA
jgi:hypothetical protein